jgi:hypothetical protein
MWTSRLRYWKLATGNLSWTRNLLGGAELRDPFGMARRLSRAQVTADLFCSHMTADGEVKLTGATVGAKVGLHKSVFTHVADLAIDAGGQRAQGFLLSHR